jgi:hypothetical protein
MNTEPEPPATPVQSAKPRKKREMTPELLDKLKLARERAAELRASAKETKSKLPDNIPEKEKTKVAQYLTTRKAIREKIKQEIVEEIEKAPIVKPSTEHEVDCDGYMLPMKSTDAPPPLPKKSQEKAEKSQEKTEKPQEKAEKLEKQEAESDSEDEYTTIKVPKKKIIKWKKYAERPPAEPEKPKRVVPQYNPYTTSHLVNLAMSGYKF